MAVHFGLDGARPASVDALLAAVDPEDRERLAGSVAHAVRAGAPLDLEFRTVAGGAPRWLRAIGWCGLDKHGHPERFDGVTLDIDSQKYAEQELQRLAHELGQKNRAQSDFLFTLAHDMSGFDAAEAMRRIPGMEDATLVALTGWGRNRTGDVRARRGSIIT